MVKYFVDCSRVQIEAGFDPESLRHERPIVDFARTLERSRQIVRLHDFRTIFLKN